MAESRIQILPEEDGTPDETAAQQLAFNRDLPWENINTTNVDKDRMGIPRNYLHGPFNQDQKREWDRQREEFMAGKIVAHRNTAQNALVICGFDHSEPLATLLGADGIFVRVFDYKNLDWYRQGIFAENA